MKHEFKVGDLVKDILNEGDGCYGLGVVVGVDVDHLVGQTPQKRTTKIPGGRDRYDVYFTKFEKAITFHGDYLEKV